MKFAYSERIKKIPPYLFAKLDAMKQEAIAAGKDVISLSIGDPDMPTLRPVIEEAKKAIEDPSNHRYPSYVGMMAFREAVAAWYQKRFGVDLNPKNEVIALIGAKEGIAHLPFAYINPGDTVLIPSPGYPVYYSSTIFTDGIPYVMPLREGNQFFPDYNEIPEKVRNQTKLMWLNYPNNPTAQVANPDFFKRTVEFAAKYGIIVAHDAPYSELYYDNEKPISFLATEGAKEVGVEFHSLSKTCNMTGWRIAMCSGNQEVVKGLGDVKENMDTGVFGAIQMAAIKGLLDSDEETEANRKVWQARRDELVDGLTGCGWKVFKPKASFHCWIKNQPGYSSFQMVEKLLKDASVICSPGNGFGAEGEGYIRMTFTVNKERIQEAIQRIKQIHW